MIYLNGKVVANVTPDIISLTQSEYDILTDEQKMNGTVYFITDGEDDNFARLSYIDSVIGTADQISNIADGTIIGVIKLLYERLGGLSFVVDTTTGQYTTTYNADEPEIADTPTMSDFESDTQKIEHLCDILGSPDDLSKMGYISISEALVDLVKRFGGLSFTYDEENNIVHAIYNE